MAMTACTLIPHFSTNSGNDSLQTTPARGPQNRHRPVWVVHARSSQGGGRPLSLALLPFTHRRQLGVRERTLGQIASMPATGLDQSVSVAAEIADNRPFRIDPKYCSAVQQHVSDCHVMRAGGSRISYNSQIAVSSGKGVFCSLT
jgi:hypothetical protein